MSLKRKLSNGWQFSKQPLRSELAKVAADADWIAVTLPHDWLIYDTRNLYENGEGWYRTRLRFDAVPVNELVFLRFEGVYMNSTLYVNGQVAGEWKYGYSTFEFEITPHLVAGENEIYMRVIHESPNSRWYSGAGIYRPVWLKTVPKTHIAADGLYIAARTTEGQAWTVDVDAELHTAEAAGSGTKMKLRHSILDAAGTLVAGQVTEVTVQGELTVHTHSRLTVDQPLLWDISSPNLYWLQTELLVEDEVIEVERERFGFRTLELDSNVGFSSTGVMSKYMESASIMTWALWGLQ